MKLRCGDKLLRDFGQGTTDDPAKAREFSADEAHVLRELYPAYSAEGGPEPSALYAKTPPAFSPGHDRVWARYKNTWIAIDRQAAFLATRLALDTHARELNSETA